MFNDEKIATHLSLHTVGLEKHCLLVTAPEKREKRSMLDLFGSYFELIEMFVNRKGVEKLPDFRELKEEDKESVCSSVCECWPLSLWAGVILCPG